MKADDRREDVLRFVRSFEQTFGRRPNLPEIARAVGCSKTAAHYDVKHLVRVGELEAS